MLKKIDARNEQILLPFMATDDTCQIVKTSTSFARSWTLELGRFGLGFTGGGTFFPGAACPSFVFTGTSLV